MRREGGLLKTIIFEPPSCHPRESGNSGQPYRKGLPIKRPCQILAHVDFANSGMTKISSINQARLKRGAECAVIKIVQFTAHGNALGEAGDANAACRQALSYIMRGGLTCDG